MNNLTLEKWFEEFVFMQGWKQFDHIHLNKLFSGEWDNMPLSQCVENLRKNIYGGTFNNYQFVLLSETISRKTQDGDKINIQLSESILYCFPKDFTSWNDYNNDPKNNQKIGNRNDIFPNLKILNIINYKVLVRLYEYNNGKFGIIFI